MPRSSCTRLSRMQPSPARGRGRSRTRASDRTRTGGEERAIDPRRVLLAAILLPGFGHVLCGAGTRGLMLQAFMILGGWITWHLTPPDRDLVGRLAGGLFIYALSIPDAYRIAKLRRVATAARS